MAYDVEAIRRKLRQSTAGKFTDPDEFKPKKAENEITPIKYRFFVLPPIMAGDKLKNGVTQKGMEQFFVTHGDHWIKDKPNPCPRVWDNSECEICQFGFDMLREEKDEDARRQIIKQWMPTTYYSVNIFFPRWKDNPEDLQGRVKWYKAPKTCFDIWTACLLREDSGDPEEPEPYGVFFDESSAFLFELQVLKQGKANSYRTSKFLAQGGKGIPMVRNEDNSPNEKGISALLRLRHNLFDKLEVPDPVKIKRLYSIMVDGDDEEEASGGFDKDETVGESKEKKSDPSEKKSEPEEKPKEKKSKKKEPEPEPEVDDEVIDDGSSLADEKPIEEEKKEKKSDSDDVDSDEIQALLSQLTSDD